MFSHLIYIMKKHKCCEISGSYGGEYEDYCLLGNHIALTMKAASTPQTSVKFLPHYTAQHKLLSL
jgi:hypothetical protein